MVFDQAQALTFALDTLLPFARNPFQASRVASPMPYCASCAVHDSELPFEPRCTTTVSLFPASSAVARPASLPWPKLNVRFVPLTRPSLRVHVLAFVLSMPFSCWNLWASEGVASSPPG